MDSNENQENSELLSMVIPCAQDIDVATMEAQLRLVAQQIDSTVEKLEIAQAVSQEILQLEFSV